MNLSPRAEAGRSTYFENDGHWSRLGHEAAAQALQDRVARLLAGQAR